MFNLIDSTLTLTARFWIMNFDLPPRYMKGFQKLGFELVMAGVKVIMEIHLLSHGIYR